MSETPKLSYPGFYDVVNLVRWKLLDDLNHVLGYIESGYDYHFSDDPLDWLREDPNHQLATLCSGCHTEWLWGPEDLAAGMCWRCRTEGGRR